MAIDGLVTCDSVVPIGGTAHEGTVNDGSDLDCNIVIVTSIRSGKQVKDALRNPDLKISPPAFLKADDWNP